MRIIKYFLFVSFVVLSCNDHGKKIEIAAKDSSNTSPTGDTTKTVSSSDVVEGFRDSLLQDRITDTLMKIPFVKETDRYLDSLTGHKHGISFVMDSVASNEISVMAGYNGPERFETYYNFTVYPKTFDIAIENTGTGELIPIDQYIKLKKK